MSLTSAPVADVSALDALAFAQALRAASRRMLATLDAATCSPDPRGAIAAALATLDADKAEAVTALFPLTRSTR